LLTTHYFGIGASGSNAKEMITSYLSLGFHPNWRGVLYGTIVMVIMITFPRKFKKLCKTISAPFIAVVITLILNLFLNPSYMVSAINEIGGFSFSTAALLPESNIFDRIPVHSLAVILIVGAWENVKWKEIKKVFSSPVNVLFFDASVIATLYFGYIYGVIFSALLYFIYSFCSKKSLSESNN
jgi:MFS superfamily sulfate permease-like transporter